MVVIVCLYLIQVNIFPKFPFSEKANKKKATESNFATLDNLIRLRDVVEKRRDFMYVCVIK